LRTGENEPVADLEWPGRLADPGRPHARYGADVARPVPDLSAAAWAVLGAVAEGPTHGFAVAQLLAADGDLGRVWTVARPMVYRELDKLIQLHLVAEGAIERTGQGPARTIVEATPTGRGALRRWLIEPVKHVRDVRSALLLKLALLARSDVDPRPLLAAQREWFEPQLAGLEQTRDQAEGFERTVAQWRLANSRATLRFIDAALADALATYGQV
jgi:DNA-binding PadR family transcriptional regulator